MTYRMEYNGEAYEIAGLDAAVENAKQAIADDVRGVTHFSVEQDETINNWYVQGVADGQVVGPTAVVSAPEQTTVASEPTPSYADDARLRGTSFTGATPAEVFAQATSWLAGHPDVSVADLGWHTGYERGTYQLRLYYHRR